MPFTYDYPMPAVTLDAAVLRPNQGRIEILLIERGNSPFQGMNALPGGFLEMDEEPVSGATRELAEETGLRGLSLFPLFGAGKVGRDPRNRNITLVFGTLVRGDDLAPKGSDDAAHAGWYPLANPPQMAFDHATVLAQIAMSLRWQAKTAIVGRQLFGGEAGESAITDLHRLITGDAADRPVERGLRLGLLEPGKPEGIYRFPPHAWEPGVPHPYWTALPW